MGNVMNRNLIRAIIERAAKTAAQSLLLFVGAAEGLDLFTLDWQRALGAAAAGALLSVLTSIASLGIGPADSPSLVAPIVSSDPVTPLIPPSI
jgi:hypothetical protein